jgi:hypothetical protein
VTIRSPDDAPARTDLPYLRHRKRPTPPPVPKTPPIVTRKTPPPVRSTPIDLTPIDLTPASDAPVPVPVSPRVRPTAPVVGPGPRARRGTPTILTPKEPVVTLSRVQSGVGVLRIEAACSDAVGDLRLGCAYRLRSGLSSVVRSSGGPGAAPPGSHRPVILGERAQYEQLTVDLVQARDIDRLLVYASPGGGAPVNWGGTLVVTTFGGARLEVPLDRPPSAGVLAVLSLYNIAGEFVLRAELDEVAGTVRDAVQAHGYDRITWLDAATPLV